MERMIFYYLVAFFVGVIFASHATNKDEGTLSLLAGAFWPVTVAIFAVAFALYCWKYR